MIPRLWPAVFTVGWLILAIAVAEFVMAAVALAADDGEASGFLIGGSISTVVGGAAVLATKGRPFELRFRDAIILTVSAWFVVPVFAALPFVLEPVSLSTVDAYFEMISGITTTGSTVMVGLDDQPPSLLLWRSTVQWLGGFGIVGLAIVILPFLRIGGMQLFQLESSDRSDKVLPRLRTIASVIGQIYLGLTALCFAVYVALGMSPFDAINHAFTTICTGGFSTHDASFGYFESPALRWAGTVFMAAGAVPFLAYFRIARRGREGLQIDSQVVAMVGVFAFFSIGLAAYLGLTGQLGIGWALTDATFNVVSVITTTGYASADYGTWGGVATLAFLIMMFLGGCTGSTAGGIKIMRLQIMAATIVQQMRRLIHPHGVQPVRFAGHVMTSDEVVSVGVFIFVYLALVTAGALILRLSGLGDLTSFSGAAQAVGNVGPGLGATIGPAGNFSTLSGFQKIVLSVMMVLGRLEILSVLVLFTPRFYR